MTKKIISIYFSDEEIRSFRERAAFDEGEKIITPYICYLERFHDGKIVGFDGVTFPQPELTIPLVASSYQFEFDFEPDADDFDWFTREHLRREANIRSEFMDRWPHRLVLSGDDKTDHEPAEAAFHAEIAWLKDQIRGDFAFTDQVAEMETGNQPMMFGFDRVEDAALFKLFWVQ